MSDDLRPTIENAMRQADLQRARKMIASNEQANEALEAPMLSPDDLIGSGLGKAGAALMTKAGLPMVLAGLRGAGGGKPRVAMTSDGYRFIEKPDGSWETADGMGFPDFKSLVDGLDDPHLTLDGKIYDEVARQRDIKEMGYDTMQHGMPPGWADFMVPGPEERAIAAQRRRSQMTLVPDKNSQKLWDYGSGGEGNDVPVERVPLSEEAEKHLRRIYQQPTNLTEINIKGKKP